MKLLICSMNELFKRFGFKYYNNDRSINLYAVRRNVFNEGKISTVNKFNDFIFIDMFNNKDKKRYIYRYKCTTIPGISYLGKDGINSNGAFILVPSTHKNGKQYKFQTGVLHHGKYECLGESIPVIGFRDNDKDNKIDLLFDDKSKLFSDTKGTIHIHHAGEDSVLIDKWSAGCQVIANLKDWEHFFSCIKMSEELYGKEFTYTLFNENDLNTTEKSILLG